MNEIANVTLPDDRLDHRLLAPCYGGPWDGALIPALRPGADPRLPAGGLAPVAAVHGPDGTCDGRYRLDGDTCHRLGP